MVTAARPLTHLMYPIDESYLLDIFHRFEHRMKPYSDKRYTDSHPDWTILRLEPDYFSQIFQDLGVSGAPRFYLLKPFAKIPPHIDDKTLCSVNFILGDKDPAPICIDGIDYNYTQAVLDTQRIHQVMNAGKQRLLFKISVFDESYSSIVEKIKFKKDSP
jgi:hypothetical protein